MTFEEFKQYKKELLVLLPKLNTNEGSEAYKRLWDQYWGNSSEGTLNQKTPNTAKVLDNLL